MYQQFVTERTYSQMDALLKINTMSVATGRNGADVGFQGA